MNKNLLSPFNRFLAVFGMFLMVGLPVKADWYWRRPAPVVVYHQPAPVVVYHETPPADAVVLGACAVGMGIGAGIAKLFTHSAEKRKFREYTEMFRNIGYSRSDAQIYAKLAVENPGGYEAVIKNIEREKELKFKRETEQKLAQLQIRGEQELSQLKHEQKIKELTHVQQSQNDNYQKIALILLIVFLSVGTLCMGVMLVQRLKRNN